MTIIGKINNWIHGINAIFKGSISSGDSLPTSISHFSQNVFCVKLPIQSILILPSHLLRTSHPIYPHPNLTFPPKLTHYGIYQPSLLDCRSWTHSLHLERNQVSSGLRESCWRKDRQESKTWERRYGGIPVCLLESVRVLLNMPKTSESQRRWALFTHWPKCSRVGQYMGDGPPLYIFPRITRRDDHLLQGNHERVAGGISFKFGAAMIRLPRDDGRVKRDTEMLLNQVNCGKPQPSDGHY